jgi:acetyl esterase
MTAAGPFIRPDVSAFLAKLDEQVISNKHEIDINSLRTGYAASKTMLELPVGDLATIIDLVIPGPAGPIPARLFDVQRARAPGPLAVFFHGGGFMIGDASTHASLCAEISRALDLPVLSVEYRLAPENPWPAAPEDVEAATRWAAAAPKSLGREVTSLLLCGDSAGGNLAIVTAMRLRDVPAAVPAIGQLLFYPLLDPSSNCPIVAQFDQGYYLTRASMHASAAAYRADADDSRAVPLAGDLAGLPPAVVMTAGLDPIRDHGRNYAAGLTAAGVEVIFQEAEGNIHGFATLRKRFRLRWMMLTGRLWRLARC